MLGDMGYITERLTFFQAGGSGYFVGLLYEALLRTSGTPAKGSLRPSG
jgi:hypothetical protein